MAPALIPVFKKKHRLFDGENNLVVTYVFL